MTGSGWLLLFPISEIQGGATPSVGFSTFILSPFILYTVSGQLQQVEEDQQDEDYWEHDVHPEIIHFYIIKIYLEI